MLVLQRTGEPAHRRECQEQCGQPADDIRLQRHGTIARPPELQRRYQRKVHSRTGPGLVADGRRFQLVTRLESDPAVLETEFGLLGLAQEITQQRSGILAREIDDPDVRPRARRFLDHDLQLGRPAAEIARHELDLDARALGHSRRAYRQPGLHRHPDVGAERRRFYQQDLDALLPHPRLEP